MAQEKVHESGLDLDRAIALVPLLLGVLGAASIAVATRLPWHSYTYSGVDGFGTGMGETGSLLVWLAVLMGALAFSAEIHRYFAAAGLALCGILTVMAWGQLAREHDELLAALGPDLAAGATTSPLLGTWLLVGGAGLAALGFVITLLRR